MLTFWSLLSDIVRIETPATLVAPPPTHSNHIEQAKEIVTSCI